MTIDEYIQKTGRTKQLLADLAGVSWLTIHRISRGQRPRPETAQAIQRATDGAVTADELLGLTSRREVFIDGERYIKAPKEDPCNRG